MTPEQQRIAIAEACGWLDIKRATRMGKPREDGVVLIGTKDRASINYAREYEKLPDYFNDLNAMHEAVSALEIGHDGSQMADYQGSLMTAVGIPSDVDICELGNDVAYLALMTEATAPQRAEAFLRAIGKWEDK